MTSNTEFYEAFASSYEAYYANVDAPESVRQWLYVLEKESLIPTLESRLSNPPLLLDLGCGPGWHLRPWKEASFEVCGLDSSPTMLRRAAGNANAGIKTDIPLYCADITKPECLAAISRKFKVIVGHFNFLNLFNAPQISSLFTAFSLLLERDGIFVTDMTSPYEFTTHDKNTQQQTFHEWTRHAELNNEQNVVVLWKRESQTVVETFWSHQFEWLSEKSKSKGIQLVRKIGWFPEEIVSQWRDAEIAPRFLLVFRKCEDCPLF